MLKLVGLAFLAGVFIALFFFGLNFVLFGVPEGLFSKVFWLVVYVLCPSWLLSPNIAVVTVANGILYGGLAAIWGWLRVKP